MRLVDISSSPAVTENSYLVAVLEATGIIAAKFASDSLRPEGVEPQAIPLSISPPEGSQRYVEDSDD